MLHMQGMFKKGYISGLVSNIFCFVSEVYVVEVRLYTKISKL